MAKRYTFERVPHGPHSIPTFRVVSQRDPDIPGDNGGEIYGEYATLVEAMITADRLNIPYKEALREMHRINFPEAPVYTVPQPIRINISLADEIDAVLA